MAHVETTTTAARLPEVEARAWAFARRVSVFGYAELTVELTISQATAKTIVAGWIAAGRVQVRNGGHRNQRKMFELTPEHREPGDRTSLIRQQLWTAMRGLRSFGPLDLVAHCRADLRVVEAEASSYAQALLRAGYLRVTRTAIPGERTATYQLILNTGPQAPRERRIQAVWDPNDGAYAYISGLGRMERS